MRTWVTNHHALRMLLFFPLFSFNFSLVFLSNSPTKPVCSHPWHQNSSPSQPKLQGITSRKISSSLSKALCSRKPSLFLPFFPLKLSAPLHTLTACSESSSSCQTTPYSCHPQRFSAFSTERNLHVSSLHWPSKPLT